MSDDELLELINKKDTDALDFLICKYKDLVNSKVGYIKQLKIISRTSRIHLNHLQIYV